MQKLHFREQNKWRLAIEISVAEGGPALLGPGDDVPESIA